MRKLRHFPEEQQNVSVIWVGTAILMRTQMEVKKPVPMCSEARAMLRMERLGRGSWLMETDTESNSSCAHCSLPTGGSRRQGLSTSLSVDWEEEEGLTDAAFQAWTVALFCG